MFVVVSAGGPWVGGWEGLVSRKASRLTVDHPGCTVIGDDGDY